VLVRTDRLGLVASGLPRDSLHLIDLIYRHEAGPRPKVIVGDTRSYSDMLAARGGGVDVLRQAAKADLALSQSVHRVDQVAERTAETIEAPHDHGVAGADLVE